MINEAKYLQTVSNTKADIKPFIDSALKNPDFRDILVKHLTQNEAINVYFHSFTILNEALKKEPSLFYSYWDSFVSLLKHNNSYHRNYGMDLIANLISVDKDCRFELIVENYYKQLNDEKISTIKYCISNSAKILKKKPHLTSRIITLIIDSLRVNDHSEKHQNFLISDLLKLLNSTTVDLSDLNIITDFFDDILKTTNSEKIKREIKNHRIYATK